MNYREQEELKAEIRRKWGTDEEYYKECERFHEQHKNADAIEYETETQTPIKAVYRFQPLLVWREHQELMKKLREAATTKGSE